MLNGCLFLFCLPAVLDTFLAFFLLFPFYDKVLGATKREKKHIYTQE